MSSPALAEISSPDMVDGGQVRAARRSLALRLWSLYPLLVPFYVFGKTRAVGMQANEGGVPQPADFWFLLIAAYVLTHLPLYLLRRSLPTIGFFACFVAYSALVNLAWATILDDLSLLKNTLFYVYDLALLTTCLLLYARYRDELLRTTIFAVIGSTVLQALLSPLSPHESFYRQAGFFNDENQLGYFCVLAAVVVAAGATRVAIPRPAMIAFIIAVGHLAFIAQCRAALLGLAAVAVVAVIHRPVRLFVLLAALGLAYGALKAAPELVGKEGERLVVGGGYDTLSTRGYDRIVNHPEYLLFGAGEGAYLRFRSDLPSELHSGYGTILFCYGAIGATLFACALASLCRPDLRVALWLVPILVFASAHHGLRFAFAWATLGFLACVALQPRPGPAAFEEPA